MDFVLWAADWPPCKSYCISCTVFLHVLYVYCSAYTTLKNLHKTVVVHRLWYPCLKPPTDWKTFGNTDWVVHVYCNMVEPKNLSFIYWICLHNAKTGHLTEMSMTILTLKQVCDGWKTIQSWNISTL